MGLIRRCSACRRSKVRYSGKTISCDHKEATWGIKYRIGGKQVFKKIGSNKREAERHLLRIQSEIATSGAQQDIKPILFRELAERWMKNHELGANPKVGTLWAYDSRLRFYILPNLGQKIANQISVYDLESLKHKLREKLSARYTNAILVTIGSILKYGLILGFCRTNPATLVPKYKIDKGVGIPMTSEDAVKLLKYSNEPFRTIFFAMLCTGLRVGEVTGIMWKDVDFKNDLISIERNVFHAPKGKYGMKDKCWIFGTPKSKESTRKVFMIPALKTALLRHSEQSQGNELGLVFCTKTGKPYDRSTLRQKLLSVLEAASLKHVRLHDFRHSNATWLLANGANLAGVSKHLGHSGVGITGDFYHHVSPKEQESNKKLMADIFPVWDATGKPEPPASNESKSINSY